MKAHDLSDRIWNGISDLVRRSATPREIYFVKVVKVDKIKGILFAAEFGSLGIPLVALTTTISYFDSVATHADIVTGDITTEKQKRGDATHTNPVYRTELVMPKVGQTVVILDPWGAKRFPFCIGVLQSKAGFWEEAT